jgi:transcriptional regulator with XRE-family HTH domain
MVPRTNQVDALAAVIGQRLRDLRRSRGLTLAQLAVASGVASKGHLSDLENGRILPTVGTLQSLASALGVELLDLVINPTQSPRHRLVAHTSDLPAPVMERWLTEADNGSKARRRPRRAQVVEKTKG